MHVPLGIKHLTVGSYMKAEIYQGTCNYAVKLISITTWMFFVKSRRWCILERTYFSGLFQRSLCLPIYLHISYDTKPDGINWYWSCYLFTKRSFRPWRWWLKTKYIISPFRSQIWELAVDEDPPFIIACVGTHFGFTLNKKYGNDYA